MLRNILYSLKNECKEKWKLGQLNQSATAFELSRVLEKSNVFLMFITNNMQEAVQLKNEIKMFTKKNVFIFPDWESLPFEELSPHKNIISSRISILYKLYNLKKGLLIISINSILQKLCPRQYLLKEKLSITNKNFISYEYLIKILKNKGYNSVNQISLPGEYKINKNLIEFYSMGVNFPYRLKFLDKKIVNISFFDSHTQKKIKDIEIATLLPANEFPNNKKSIAIFCQKWEKQFNGTLNDNIYKQVKHGILPPGIEYWQPFFFKNNLETIFHYLPNNTTIIYTSNIKKNIFVIWKQIKKKYHHFILKSIRPLIHPNTLWIDPKIFLYKLYKWSNIEISEKKISNSKNHINLLYDVLPNIDIQNDNKINCSKLSFFLEKFSGIIIFCINNHHIYENLYKSLILCKKKPKIVNSIEIFNYLKYNLNNHKYFLMSGAYKNGFIDVQYNIAFICENDLKLKINSHETINTSNTNKEITIGNVFNDIQINQAVVHFEHGIGRYQGLINIITSGIESEYLILEYANDAKLYVPITHLHLISYYTGFTDTHITLHKLGTENWNKEKQKAFEKIHDIAINLQNLYSFRKSQTGFSFKIDVKNYQHFCNFFTFPITLDQKVAIDSVLKDMKKNLPMDRLICGDVGFGKTEVAMRAAFIAVSNNKQVAILVPTTILAQQYFYNFQKRFSNFSFTIDIISRLYNTHQKNISFENIKNGKTNIFIGTHILLIKKIKWHDLGLLIIDEEHRFGVYHKEIIKTHYINIDVLTLTATPIPRTLNMAMHDIRDLSVIATPPEKRIIIKTFIHEYNNTLIRNAIMKEILRGGQVYYLYNNVKKIQNKSKKLSKLIPEASIGVGHGQMQSKDLDNVIKNFLYKKYNVLVCTSIIETGIDIPNVNTIIIENADFFGLAQLHQLRGRVGRSHRQAYAWLLVSNLKNITLDAKKRLEAIATFKSFGSGLTLATHDLEIRGVGEFLGKNQSGHVCNIGYDLYMQILNNTIQNIKNKHSLSLEKIIVSQPEIELNISAFIPIKYINNMNVRFCFYKKIVMSNSIKKIKNISLELTNRFGKIPNTTENLIIISKIKIISKNIGIKKIQSNNKEILIQFLENNKINITLLLTVLQSDKNIWNFKNSHCLRLKNQFINSKIRILWILNFLNKINISNF